MRSSIGILAFCGTMMAAGCQSNEPAPPPQRLSQQSAAANNGGSQKRFDDADAGISLMYPSDWKPVTGSKSQLKVSAPAGGELTLDVPVLPMHLPGLIPVDAVRDGYVNDQKKKMPDAQVTALPDPSVPDAKQKRVKLSGHENGKSVINEAALIVHNDHVYVLSVEGDDKSYPPLHSMMDQVLKSLQWTK